MHYRINNLLHNTAVFIFMVIRNALNLDRIVFLNLSLDYIIHEIEAVHYYTIGVRIIHRVELANTMWRFNLPL